MTARKEKTVDQDQEIGPANGDWRGKPKFRNWLWQQRTDTGHMGVLSRRTASWDDWESPDELRAALTARKVVRGYFETLDVAEQRWMHRIKHTTVCVQLDDDDADALVKLAEVYGSSTKALRFAIRALHARTPAAQSGKEPA